MRAGGNRAGSFFITGGTGFPVKLMAGAVPMISAPTGTMANNGAVTLGTALNATYANCYLFLPAGSIAAGVPAAAAWLFTQMSSATVGTVFNNTYTTGIPTVPASPTAFATTGPGAFTGDTSEQGITISVPANALSTGGRIIAQCFTANNNTAGTKTFRIRYSAIGGAAYVTQANTTAVNALLYAEVNNAGVTGQQFGYGVATVAAAIALNGASSTVDTTTATTVVTTCQKGTATDYAILFPADYTYMT